MAEMRRGPVSLMVAAFILAAVLTSSQGNKPPATMGVPSVFKPVTHAPTPNVTTHTPTPNVTTHTPTPNVTTHTPTPNVTTHTPTPNVTTHTPTPNVTTHTPTPNVTTHTPTPNVTTHTTAPHNVTTAAPTTTPKPGPTPSTNLTVGNYTYKSGGNVCVMILAAIKLNVNNSQNEGTFVVQPKDVKVTGKCETNTAEIKLSFSEGFISLGFVKNDSVYLSSVNVTLSYAFKSGVIQPVQKMNNSLRYFSMTPGHSYSCKSESVSLGDGISLDFSEERCQAFDFQNIQFGPVDLCKADQPNYNVAVAVGIVLLILIVIVVIAYLISRRKRTDGYQTL